MRHPLHPLCRLIPLIPNPEKLPLQWPLQVCAGPDLIFPFAPSADLPATVRSSFKGLDTASKFQPTTIAQNGSRMDGTDGGINLQEAEDQDAGGGKNGGPGGTVLEQW